MGGSVICPYYIFVHNFRARAPFTLKFWDITQNPIMHNSTILTCVFQYPKTETLKFNQRFFADIIKNNDVTKLFIIYLEFIHGKENVC